MTILLDESVPRALAHRLPDHAVDTVQDREWDGVKNGSLLRLIAHAGFDVFITADKNLTYQQPTSLLPFAVLVLSTNHWPTLKHNVQAIRTALELARAGEVLAIDCGIFSPSVKR